MAGALEEKELYRFFTSEVEMMIEKGPYAHPLCYIYVFRQDTRGAFSRTLILYIGDTQVIHLWVGACQRYIPSQQPE